MITVLLTVALQFIGLVQEAFEMHSTQLEKQVLQSHID